MYQASMIAVTAQLIRKKKKAKEAWAVPLARKYISDLSCLQKGNFSMSIRSLAKKIRTRRSNGAFPFPNYKILLIDTITLPKSAF